MTKKRNEELEVMQAILNILEPLEDDYRARNCLRWCMEHIELKQCSGTAGGIVGGAKLGNHY